MKKSEQLRIAQLAVLRYTGTPDAEKLVILRTLQAAEDLEKMLERREAEKEAAHESV